MKFGIVSDTHSNYHALKAVLEHMNSVGVDKKVHCGDIIGYGAKPSETLALTLQEFNYIVMGNHDLAVVNEEASWGFNPQAKEAVDWTRNKLTDDEIGILKNLKYKYVVGEDIMFVHGSPAQGRPHDYIIDEKDASLAFLPQNFTVAFVGHTHVPFLWTEDCYVKPEYNDIKNSEGIAYAGYSWIDKNKRMIVNVGSVGQPRNGDPRASYVIYDTDARTVDFYKVPYPVDRAVGLMQRAGFSNRACERLLFGR